MKKALTWFKKASLYSALATTGFLSLHAYDALSAVKPLNDVRVNQHGYLPNQPKHAVFVGPAGTNWRLKNSQGDTVARGTTTRYGFDKASGDTVSHIDFSSFTREGDQYTLEVGSEVSYPFKISDYTYTFMKEDAMMYFYHQRFGHAVEAKYVGKEFARAAGHFDNNLVCDDDLPSDWDSSSQCNYRLNVQGGHQDAGDYGGYVVNGGYYNWLLQYMYEANNNIFNDGSLLIPENQNGIPDILDEARIVLDFILRMQVPQRLSPYPGMIHHKKSYQAWAPFPLAPADDDGAYFGNPQVKRTIKPVSTSATLNGAAVMAQAARIWEQFPDAPGFDGSSQPYYKSLIRRAEIAWQAALDNPDLFASSDASKGSGPYDDKRLEDEFYWAAVELYLTTKKEVYKNYLTNSPIFAQYAPFDWKDIDVAGNLSLLLHKETNGLTAAQNNRLLNNLKTYTDSFLETIESEGYMSPLAPTKRGSSCGGGDYIYEWGSAGSFVMSHAVQLTAVHRATQDKKYLDAITRTMDHVMGVNALDRVYMTGYGENATKEPHHRFWLKSKGNPVTDVAASITVPYPGAMAGGPQNDVIADGSSPETDGTPCVRPAKSYADHWNNYSSNEVTVNWNANLAAVTSYIDEAIPAPADRQPPAKPTGVTATANSGTSIIVQWPDAFDNGQVKQYYVYMKPNNGRYELYATTRFNKWAFVPLKPNTNYCFKIEAEDFNGNRSTRSNEICERTFNANKYEIFYQPDNSAMSDYVGTGAINQPEAPTTIIGNGWYHYKFRTDLERSYDFHFSQPNFGSSDRFSPTGKGANWKIEADDFNNQGTIWLTADKKFHKSAPVLKPIAASDMGGTAPNSSNLNEAATPPVRPVTPAEPVTPVEEPVQPERPTSPETPTEPETPVQPERPTRPETPAEPEAPVQPERPTRPETPAEPEAPVQPERPTRPETPAEPETPVQPVTPTSPVVPVEPETPARPSTPVRPVAPVEPVRPITPVQPVQPVTPVTPNTPETPVNTATPSEPVNTATPALPPTNTQSNTNNNADNIEEGAGSMNLFYVLFMGLLVMLRRRFIKK